VLLDSSVLIAILNPRDKHHQVAIDSYSSADRYQISAISLTEVLPAAIKAGRASAVRQKLEEIARVVVDLDSEIGNLAAQVRVETGLKTPDAIISATAQARKAQLWTFDAGLAKVHKGARLLA
jgi:predicted nucleic acid-binding protein